MKNKSKGTTLIEIMVSVLLISFVMVFLFNILVNMKEEYNLSTERSQDSLNRAAFTRIIQNDFIEIGLKKINILSSDGNKNRFAIQFELSNNSKKNLVVENTNGVGRVVYDGEIWTLSSGTYDISNITFLYIEPKYEKYRSTVDNRYLNDPNSNYHLFKLNVPVSTDILSTKKYNVEITHMGFDKASFEDANFCKNVENYFKNRLNYGQKYSENVICIRQ